MTSRAQRKKNADARRERAALDARKKTELNSSALAASYGDGISPSSKTVPRRATSVRPASPRATPAAAKQPGPWLRHTRRILDVLATAGGVWLRTPAKRP